MQKVLTAEQMREVDRLTTARYGISSLMLMENAAHAVARVITEKLGGSVNDRTVLILCGPGNNGGDGAALARILWTAGARVSVEVFGPISRSKGDARANFEILKSLFDSGSREGCLCLREVDRSLDDNGFDDWLDSSNFDDVDVMVDALFGTGLSRQLSDFFALQTRTLANWKRSHAKPLIVSIDIPSGLSADLGDPIGENVLADLTVTFTAPKTGNVVAPASGSNGKLIVEQIGSPSVLIDGQASKLFVAQPDDAALWLRRSEFTNASYKNRRGHLLLIAGSKNYSGAAVLCGDAAIRSGVGLVTIATPESSREAMVARISPEVMVRGVSETEGGSVAEPAVDEINEFSKNVDAIAAGSGLSTDEETMRFVRRLVTERTKPMIVDADGLTALSPLREAQSADLAPLVLTPHEGEFRKLLGVEKGEADEILKDRVKAVRDFATTRSVILVLKGERVLVGHPDGRVVVNPTGNSGLGKAGNGDTLTGILGGFVSQATALGIDIFDTVVAAVYVAGMAGDVAEAKFGKRVMTASDVRECLVDVFDELGGS